MPKTITIRLSDEDYNKINLSARIERRTISNFITVKVLKDIEEAYYADIIETREVQSDKYLSEKLKAGHKDAKKSRGRLVG
ncbi:MAG: hypothetical protein HQL28_04130 [Candidatus Omnitrophica bacterium]|nr:hypothetical protein [Candidatus Omnitrophota bacterium]